MSDGTTHINIYSRGETELGRALSNFAALGVKTLDGTFDSLEGYWYWLSVDEKRPDRDRLRRATGYQAKQLGRELRGADWQPDNDALFKVKMMHAMLAKLALHPQLLAPFRESTLPFRHYYVYGGKEVEPKEGQWIVDTWEFARKTIRT